MSKEIVIDANVLEHANNPQEERQEHSIALIERLAVSDEILAVDEGFSMQSAANRSGIWTEYLDRMRVPGHLGREILIHLATSGRVREYSRQVPNATRKKVDQLIRKPLDRLYLRIASKTPHRLFLSHDFEDFQVPKRAHIKKELEVLILEASAYLAL